jgi:hypothetical protein
MATPIATTRSGGYLHLSPVTVGLVILERHNLLAIHSTHEQPCDDDDNAHPPPPTIPPIPIDKITNKRTTRWSSHWMIIKISLGPRPSATAKEVFTIQTQQSVAVVRCRLSGVLEHLHQEGDRPSITHPLPLQAINITKCWRCMGARCLRIIDIWQQREVVQPANFHPSGLFGLGFTLQIVTHLDIKSDISAMSTCSCSTRHNYTTEKWIECFQRIFHVTTNLDNLHVKIIYIKTMLDIGSIIYLQT